MFEPIRLSELAKLPESEREEKLRALVAAAMMPRTPEQWAQHEELRRKMRCRE